MTSLQTVQKLLKLVLSAPPPEQWIPTGLCAQPSPLHTQVHSNPLPPSSCWGCKYPRPQMDITPAVVQKAPQWLHFLRMLCKNRQTEKTERNWRGETEKITKDCSHPGYQLVSLLPFLFNITIHTMYSIWGTVQVCESHSCLWFNCNWLSAHSAKVRNYLFIHHERNITSGAKSLCTHIKALPQSGWSLTKLCCSS